MFSVLLFFLGISSGMCLTCYKCDSSDSVLCNFGLTSLLMPTVDCQKEVGGEGGFLTSWIPKECVKFTAKDNEGKEFVARGCMPKLGGACNVLVKTLGFFSNLDSQGGPQDLNCSMCDSDKCNSAYNLKPIGFYSLILGAILLVLRI